jgi:hypothetical protein
MKLIKSNFKSKKKSSLTLLAPQVFLLYILGYFLTGTNRSTEKPGEDVEDDNLDEIYDKEFKKVLEEQRLTQVNVQHLSTYLDKIGSKHEQISGAIDKLRNFMPSELLQFWLKK